MSGDANAIDANASANRNFMIDPDPGFELKVVVEVPL